LNPNAQGSSDGDLRVKKRLGLDHGQLGEYCG
jgi:hypothetical protein